MRAVVKRSSCVALFVVGAMACAPSPDASTPSGDLGASDARGPSPMPFDAGMYSAISLELGTGFTAWAPVSPMGSRVELVHGPQGGYHIYGRVRFAGFAPDVYVFFRVTPVDGGAPVNDPTARIRRNNPQGLTAYQGGWETTYGELVIFTQIASPNEVVGRHFVWEVVVQDVATGRLATTQREITVVDDEP